MKPSEYPKVPVVDSGDCFSVSVPFFAPIGDEATLKTALFVAFTERSNPRPFDLPIAYPGRFMASPVCRRTVPAS